MMVMEVDGQLYSKVEENKSCAARQVGFEEGKIGPICE
jgi:hypothetical protein